MHRRTTTTITATILVASLASAACGDAGPSASDDDRPAVTTGDTGGWIGGEPEWRAETSEDGLGAGDEAATRDLSAAPEVAAGDVASPPGDAIAPDASPLRAGSVDDNADYAGYLEYLARLASLGVPLRDFDPSGRIVVTVTGSNGLPVEGAEVVASVDGAEVARLRTTADGTVRFLPAIHGVSGAPSVAFDVTGVGVTAAPGESVSVEVAEPGGATAPIPLDVLFLLDTTGSMGDEIDRLKSTIDAVAGRIAALDAAPDVRMAMTVYRDEGDAYVTATHDFTGDVAAFRAALAEVVADGGGDYPEALDEALADALTTPSWRDPSTTVQLVFLVADAPPQVGRQVPVPYTQSIADAVARGIKIFPVASSESDDQAEAVFRQIAQATGANTDIATTDYEELSLDDLVVRLVAEELAALTGDPTQVPEPTPTPTTTPDGQ